MEKLTIHCIRPWDKPLNMLITNFKPVAHEGSTTLQITTICHTQYQAVALFIIRLYYCLIVKIVHIINLLNELIPIEIVKS